VGRKALTQSINQRGLAAVSADRRPGHALDCIQLYSDCAGQIPWRSLDLRLPSLRYSYGAAVSKSKTNFSENFALPNIGGALCSTPQSLADAHYLTAVQ